MAGLDQKTPIPQEIVLRQQSRCLELGYENGERYSLPFEFLRVFTPSAEARGHGPGQEVLQVGKRNVEITQLEAIGNYAVRPYFSDGHDTGIYSWDLLYNLGSHQDELWKTYLEQIEKTGASRDAKVSDASAEDPAKAGGCGSGGCSSGGCGSR